MDSKTIKNIASLARVELTEKEEESMKNELSSILGYVEQLEKVKTENVEPLYQTTGLVNSMRNDEEINIDESSDLSDKLINQAPHKESKFVKVKSILNR